MYKLQFHNYAKITILPNSFHTLRIEKSESKEKQKHCYKNIGYFISITDGQYITNSFLTKYLLDIKCRKNKKNTTFD